MNKPPDSNGIWRNDPNTPSLNTLITKSFWNTADSCSSVGVVAWLLAVSGEYNKHLDRNTDKKSKAVRNRTEFWTIFCPHNFFGRGGGFQKLYPVYHSCLAARRLKKFCEDTPNSPQVIVPNMLNNRPNFKFSGLNFLGGPPPSSSVHWQGLVNV